MPHRPAIAVRWMMAFVEPPSASSVVAALRNADSVIICDGLTSRLMRSTAVRPASSAARIRRASAPGIAAVPGSAMPRASHITAIVLAVPMTMQCPAERYIDSSIES